MVTRRRRYPSAVHPLRLHGPRLAGAAILLLLALIAALDRAGLFGYRGDDHAAFDSRAAAVARVIDGDTLVLVDDTRVRLLGIDAPEMNHGEGDPEHFAREASERLTALVAGRDVTLKLQPLETRDRYGRLLAYVYLDDTHLINEDLVRDGYVYADRRFNHPYAARFSQAEADARKRRRGLWQAVTPERMPAWRQRGSDRKN